MVSKRWRPGLGLFTWSTVEVQKIREILFGVFPGKAPNALLANRLIGKGDRFGLVEGPLIIDMRAFRLRNEVLVLPFQRVSELYLHFIRNNSRFHLSYWRAA